MECIEAEVGSGEKEADVYTVSDTSHDEDDDVDDVACSANDEDLEIEELNDES